MSLRVDDDLERELDALQRTAVLQLELSGTTRESVVHGAEISLAMMHGVLHAAASLDYEDGGDHVLRARAVVSGRVPEMADDVRGVLIDSLPAGVAWTLIVEDRDGDDRAWLTASAVRPRTRRGFQCRHSSAVLRHPSARLLPDLVMRSVAHGLWFAQRVRVDSPVGCLPMGLSSLTDYFAILLSPDDFALATSVVNAWRGEAVYVTAPGTGVSVIVRG